MDSLSFEVQGSGNIEGLVANGPNPALVEKLMLFGQFVGDWEAELTVHGPDGTTQIEMAEWHIGWILEGRAVQDVWIIPRRRDREKSDFTRSDYGTALRFYDPAIDAWQIVWASPPNSELITFIGRQVGDEIVLEGNDSNGTPLRWIFSDVTLNSFRWRRVFSSDGGETWQLHKEMSVRRVPVR